MKKLSKIWTVGLILLFFPILRWHVAACEGTSLIQDEIRIITSVMPAEWEVYKIDYNNKPYWSFSDDKCVRLQVYGPRMGGYDYYNIQGDEKRHITRWYYTNESRSIWITPVDFSPNWTISNRIKNRFSKTPVPYPERIYSINGFTIYGEGGFDVVLKQNEDKAKTSPPGTTRAEPVDVGKGGSWPTWIDDIKEGLRKAK